MRRRPWLALPFMLCALTAGCGDEAGSVEPITRSTLSQVPADVSKTALIDALPEAADFGPGWVFDPESVGDQDYFSDGLAGSSTVTGHCEGADPGEAGIPLGSAHAISATLKADDGSAVNVYIAVDSPASSADRVTFLRAVYEGCGKIENESETPGGKTEKIEVEFELLETSAIKADQVLAVRVKGQRTRGDADPRELGFTEALARVGALVVRLASEDGTDPRPLLPAALAEARTALKL